jgi:hypothetical protein
VGSARGQTRERPALRLILPIPVTGGHGSTYSGHRDRLDRAGLLRAIARAREAKVMTEDHARALTELIDIINSP